MALVQRLSRAMSEAHPGGAARALEKLAPQEATSALEQLPPEGAARVLERMELSHAAACLELWSAEKLPQLVVALPVELLAGVLGRSRDGIGQRLLKQAPPDIAEAARRLVLHPENSAGALMDSGVYSLPEDIDAGEARRRLRRIGNRISYYIYVVDREQRLVGVVNLRQLMQAAARQALASLMRGRAVSVSVHAGLEAILDHPGWRSFHALPVVDGKGILRGVLRYETLRRIEEQRTAHRGPEPIAVGIALMELYWSAATQVMQGAVEMAQSVAARGGKEVRDGS